MINNGAGGAENTGRKPPATFFHIGPGPKQVSGGMTDGGQIEGDLLRLRGTV